MADKKKVMQPAGKTTVVYSGRVFEVFEQPFAEPDGIKTFTFARRSPGVRIIIPTEKNMLLLTKEYRHEIDDWDYRLPGGKVFDKLDMFKASLEKGEDPLGVAEEAARRELQEEAGLAATRLTYFSTSYAGAMFIWDLHYFVADGHEKYHEGHDRGVGEDIELAEVSFEEASAMCLDARIREERSALVLLRYLEQHK